MCVVMKAVCLKRGLVVVLPQQEKKRILHVEVNCYNAITKTSL